MNIRELICKYEEEIKSFKNRNYNYNQTERAYCRGLENCITDLKQVLASCEAEVDSEIELDRALINRNDNLGLITNFQGKIHGLEQAKKIIFGGEKCSSVKQE